jgi:hypothetical protein
MFRFAIKSILHCRATNETCALRDLSSEIGAILIDLQPSARKFDLGEGVRYGASVNGIVAITIPNLPTKVNFC